MSGFIYKIMKRNSLGNWRAVPNLPTYHSREAAEDDLIKYDPDNHNSLQYTIHRTFER